MRAPSVRLRLLFLALGLTAIVGLLYWPEDEEKSWSPNPNFPTIRENGTPSAASIAQPPVSDTVPLPSPRGDLTDAEFATAAAGYGVIVMNREYGSSTTAGFFFVDLRDSAQSLGALGFIQASALLDSTRRYTGLADSGAATSFALASTARADSVLHRHMDDCTTFVPVPVRNASSDDRWSVALMPGVEPALPAGEWRAHTSAADRREALRLVRQLPNDSTETNEGFLLDSTRTPQAPEIRSLHRFTRDGTEFLVADVRIEHRNRTNPTADAVYEQRLIIAERDATDRGSTFRTVWAHRDAGYGDETSTEVPMMMIRLGPSRLLTLTTSGDYKDGGGGLFVARTGAGRWTTVASWYAGC